MRHNTTRLDVLKQLVILDTQPETAYDDLTRTLAQGFDVPITMVNLLDEKRDWFKSCVGLPMSESPTATSFCEVFFNTDDDLLVIENTTLDARFAQHPLVVGPPYVRFYAAARLGVKGETVGTLCAYDTKTKKIEPEQIEELRGMALAAMELLKRRG